MNGIFISIQYSHILLNKHMTDCIGRWHINRMHLKLVFCEVRSSQYIIFYLFWDISTWISFIWCNQTDYLCALSIQYVAFEYLCLVFIKSRFKVLKSKFKNLETFNYRLQVLQSDLCYNWALKIDNLSMLCLLIMLVS